MARRKVRLASNWKKILRHAWSIRFIVLAGILTAAEAVFPFFEDMFGGSRAFPAILFALMIAAFVARVVFQKAVR